MADEIVVDLMGSASSVAYPEASRSVEVREVDGVAIPFASVALLWKMKRGSVREKDVPDSHFLRRLLEQRGEPTD